MKTPGTTYTGARLIGPNGEALGVDVRVNGRPLDPRPALRLRQHSPTGFEWGYCGSGPAQLALAVLLHATGDMPTALAAYHWFKWEVVAGWRDVWSITAGDVYRLLDRWRAECAAAAALQLDPIEPFRVEPPTSNLVGVPAGGVR